jgi:hypothetical protein
MESGFDTLQEQKTGSMAQPASFPAEKIDQNAQMTSNLTQWRA